MTFIGGDNGNLGNAIEFRKRKERKENVKNTV